jgi:hypothetical protein
MNTITIVVPGTEYENLSISLNETEVAFLYQERKANAAKIAELEKKVKDLENTQKYTINSRDELQKELNQAHVLLTALGIMEKTEAEESWSRTKLDVSTRIALYIASNKS